MIMDVMVPISMLRVLYIILVSKYSNVAAKVRYFSVNYDKNRRITIDAINLQ